jgi:hypothetical protein
LYTEQELEQGINEQEDNLDDITTDSRDDTDGFDYDSGSDYDKDIDRDEEEGDCIMD